MHEYEKELEKQLIEQLTKGSSQWTYRPDLKTEEDLWNNIKVIIEQGNKYALNDETLSDQEFEQIKNQLSFASFYDAATWIAGENGVAKVTIQRDNRTIPLTVLKRNDVAGGSSVYEVINQYRSKKNSGIEHDQNRRYDISLLINGIPLIHIELKRRTESYMMGFRQIKKYVSEGKFTGVFSAVQMFVVSNEADTKYFAAGQADQLNEKFLFGWEDSNNQPISGIFDFANKVLKIPEAHEMVMKYTILDQDSRKLIVLRPYQIHAIEAIRSASYQSKSGYVWHTTGSGKTMTSYKAARNLLIDIPSIDKTVFLIDRIDLDTQTSQAFKSYANNDMIDVEDTDNAQELIKRLKSNSKQVIVTTIQKLQKVIKLPPDPKLKSLRIAFIVDECHRAVTPKTKRDIGNYFTDSLWYGFTGTPRFDENRYATLGDLPRTTNELYGDCLNKYTIKEGIRDRAVLGFQTEHFGYDTDMVGDNEYVAYEQEKHMLSVLNVILNRSQEKFGFSNGRGKTYTALLTVSSIEKAQQYYDLLKGVVRGEVEDLKICQKTKQTMPDFPKFAITYSVSSNENDESSEVNVPKMKEALEDYNQMFDTHFGIEEIRSYNINLNDRLARKKPMYKSRDEQLDLVIVVNRLLTGFDAPCLSTIFIDRQPSQPHDIIQTFSRTNRLFDRRKCAGYIVTFQSPDLWKEKIDEALTLFSAGGDISPIAPDERTVKEGFRQALRRLRKTAETPDVVPALSYEGKLRFAKAFQEFDRIFASLKAFSNYDETWMEGITIDEYETYAAHYINIKNDKDPEIDPIDPIVDLDYELIAFGNEVIDYEYIVGLIAQLAYSVPDVGNTTHYQKLLSEIKNYLEDLSKTNPKLSSIMWKLLMDISDHPNDYVNKDVGYVLHEMRLEAMDKLLKDFASEWLVDYETLCYCAQRYDLNHGRDIPDILTLQNSGDFDTYSASHPDIRKFTYKSKMKDSLLKLLIEEILPLRDNDYHLDDPRIYHQLLDN